MKLAIITSHPIQYYAPWFRCIASTPGIELRVFYLWDFGVTDRIDPEFQSSVRWDIPLLDGYDHEFVPNTSTRPGSEHFKGLVNPTLMARVEEFSPNAVLMMVYNYQSPMQFILRWNKSKAPLLFRGDSHRLVPRSGVKEVVRKAAIRALYRRFSALLYVGQANRDYYRMHGVPESKLFFSPHAVDNDRFMSEAEAAREQALVWRVGLGIPAEKKVILFAGKLVPKKRPLDLLEAFLRLDDPDAELLFVGSGELEVELRGRAGNHARVHFAPFQNQSEMPRTYAAADLMVLPSFGSSETWGLAVNEAMCLSRAVLVSSHVGCAVDLVRAGENGLIFEAGNVDDLTSKLKQAMQSREQLARWGRRGREIISSYSYARAAEGMCKALESLGVLSGAAELEPARRV